MQTLTLSPSPKRMRGEADAAAQLAVRLASLTAQLEQAIFERDLAQHAQARLTEEYCALAATSAVPPPDLIQELELTRHQRAQWEHEAHLLRQQCSRLETECAHWRAAHARVVEEQQFLLRDVANLGADRQDLRTYAISLKQFMAVVQHSRRWRLTQTVAGLFGRRWK